MLNFIVEILNDNIFLFGDGVDFHYFSQQEKKENDENTDKQQQKEKQKEVEEEDGKMMLICIDFNESEFEDFDGLVMTLKLHQGAREEEEAEKLEDGPVSILKKIIDTYMRLLKQNHFFRCEISVTSSI